LVLPRARGVLETLQRPPHKLCVSIVGLKIGAVSRS